MAATLVSGTVVNSWRKAHFELSLSSKENILLQTTALEEVYEDFLILR